MGGADDFITVAALARCLRRPNVVVADCRFDLADADAGRRAYARGHIPGAVYFDLEDDLSAPATSTGGRHPLPPLQRFVDVLERAGIGNDTTVVCYDDGDTSMAARLWWMLRNAGHDDVFVLDGGFVAWRAAGFAVDEKIPKPTRGRFTPRPRPELAASMDDVRAMLDAGRGVLIDSRAAERYRGEIEPLDPVAGHIPGAVNVPWTENISSAGTFHDGERCAARFQRWRDESELVVHCGSGVTGCVNLLALRRAGIDAAKLYVGGWSDWCSADENPVATPDGVQTVGALRAKEG